MENQQNQITIDLLLRRYALRQDSAFVDFVDFCAYVKKIAERNFQEQADLAKFLTATEFTVNSEIEKLQAAKLVHITDQGNRRIVIVIAYYATKFAEIYRNILSNASIPFPKLSYLPKSLPTNILPTDNAINIFANLLENQDTERNILYCVMLPRNVAPIVFPENIEVNILFEAAFSKLKLYLKKDEYHDYFLKKLRTTNSGKELSIQNFYRDLTTNEKNINDYVSTNSEYFYYLTQLCYFIRKDFAKLKDITSDDENLLQAVSIIEVQLSYLKEKIQREQMKAAAFAELEKALSQVPFFFSLDTIYKMTDSYGNLLLEQYDEDDLREYLNRATTEHKENELPNLLMFETNSNTQYFINKNNVFPLTMRLCNEAHDTIANDITTEWSRMILHFDSAPEMKDKKKFEDLLHREVKQKSPVLYALLNSSYLPVLHYEVLDNSSEAAYRLFVDNKLLPYSNILMLKQETLLSNAKMKLPFWYSIPILVAIAALLSGKKKKATQTVKEEKTSTSSKKSRDQELSSAAKKIQMRLVPEGSTIDRELDSYEKQWNKMISQKVHYELTEDVNNFIRSYLKKSLRTFSGQTITAERIDSLAETLMRAPNMQRIGSPNALKMYIKLYMVRLLGNL